MTWVKLRPGAFEQHQARYRELGRAVPGMKARWLARDMKEPDAIYAISLWDSIEAIRAWEGSEHYLKVYLPALKPDMEGEYTVSICEVQHAEGL
jgi:heme-degrading monooxygenase HmoA